MKAKRSSPKVTAHYRPSNAELDPDELLSVVEPVSAAVTASFAAWLDDELAELESDFRQYWTTDSFVASLDR